MLATNATRDLLVKPSLVEESAEGFAVFEPVPAPPQGLAIIFTDNLGIALGGRETQVGVPA